MTTVALCIVSVAAVLTSILSGILGMGGGITLLGVMTMVLRPIEVVPLHGVVQLCSNSTRTMVFVKHVRWKFFLVYAPFLTLGLWFATLVWSGEKLAWFKPWIGVFILCFLIWRRKGKKLLNPALWIYGPLGLVVGFLSVFVGATGPFLAPFFLRDDFEKEQIIATKAVCQAIAHALKIPAFLSLGFAFSDYLLPLAILTFMVIVGTLIGKRILHRMPRDLFVKLFEGVLGLIATYLILGPLVQTYLLGGA